MELPEKRKDQKEHLWMWWKRICRWVGVTAEDAEDRVGWKQVIHCGNAQRASQKKKNIMQISVVKIKTIYLVFSFLDVKSTQKQQKNIWCTLFMVRYFSVIWSNSEFYIYFDCRGFIEILKQHISAGDVLVFIFQQDNGSQNKQPKKKPILPTLQKYGWGWRGYGEWTGLPAILTCLQPKMCREFQNEKYNNADSILLHT